MFKPVNYKLHLLCNTTILHGILHFFFYCFPFISLHSENRHNPNFASTTPIDDISDVSFILAPRKGTDLKSVTVSGFECAWILDFIKSAVVF